MCKIKLTLFALSVGMKWIICLIIKRNMVCFSYSAPERHARVVHTYIVSPESEWNAFDVA